MDAWIDRAQQYEKSLGPLIEDLVKPGVQTDYDLRIETCRPRDWNSATTLDYDGRHYALVRAREQSPPRRFIYMFRISPPNRLIRSLYPYSPDELLLAQTVEGAQQGKNDKNQSGWVCARLTYWLEYNRGILLRGLIAFLLISLSSVSWPGAIRPSHRQACSGSSLLRTPPRRRVSIG